MIERHLTPQEVGEALGVRVGTVYKWLAAGRLGYAKYGRSMKAAVRIPESEVARVLAQSYHPPVGVPLADISICDDLRPLTGARLRLALGPLPKVRLLRPMKGGVR